VTGHWISKAQNGSLEFNCALLAFHQYMGAIMARGLHGLSSASLTE